MPAGMRFHPERVLAGIIVSRSVHERITGEARWINQVRRWESS
jgi:hypothetical protein